MDFMAIAVAEIGSISERRTYKLISGTRGLPPFLINNAGLNSGFMIPQYTSASLVSKNKVLCHPASVDSIDSSNGQEDHVSMGANAATKAYKVVSNLKTILSIELLTSIQSLDFHEKNTSSFLSSIKNIVRNEVSTYNEDRVMYTDIKESQAIIDSMYIDDFSIFD